MAKSSNNLVNPNAREAMDRFKMEAASHLDVPGTTKSRFFRRAIQMFDHIFRQIAYEFVVNANLLPIGCVAVCGLGDAVGKDLRPDLDALHEGQERFPVKRLDMRVPAG